MKFFSKKYLILFIFISLFLLTGLVGVYVIKSNPRYYNKIKNYAKSVIKTKDKTSYYNSKLISDDYSLHRKAAKSNGNKVISENNITQLINSGKLVKVNPNNGYKINKLTHSKHVLTPESYNMLKKIGDDFALKTKNNDFFVVTSLTRTIESQQSLSRINKNATTNISTHSYGVSFDISYTRFNGKRGGNSELQKVLEDILISYQKKKSIYVLMERQSTCYHITVRE